MYITTPKRKNGSLVVRIVESYRKDGKVKNRIIKTIGQSKDLKKIEELKLSAKRLLEEYKRAKAGEPASFFPVDLGRFLGVVSHNKGFEDILGSSYESLGFSSLIKSGKDIKSLNEALKDMVLMRVFSPSSKLRSCYLLEEHFQKQLSHKRVLNMMDHVSRGERDIKRDMFQSLLRGRKELEVLLFDVTTLYFESIRAGELRDFGYSKDGKFNEVQLVLAVLSDEEGLPLSYQVFSGGTGEAKTLQAVLQSFVKSHNIKSLKLVADRGMFSDNNFSFFEEFEKSLGIRAEYVVSSPLKKLPKELKKKVLDFKRKSLEDNKLKRGSSSQKVFKDVQSYYEFSYKGRRMVVSYSEELRKRDESKRLKILERLNDLGKGGKVPASRLIKNTGLSRYLKTVKGAIEIDNNKILQDSLWDGLYGVCSNRKERAKKLLKSYRHLWKIEELFRINKHTLKMRPIYHRLTKRIKAHILICFLAYAVLKQTEIILKKAGLSFSHQELIDTLKEVELFVIKDKRGKDGKAYIIPKKLSKQAEQIYSAFKKTFPDTAFLFTKTEQKLQM